LFRPCLTLKPRLGARVQTVGGTEKHPRAFLSLLCQPNRHHRTFSPYPPPLPYLKRRRRQDDDAGRLLTNFSGRAGTPDHSLPPLHRPLLSTARLFRISYLLNLGVGLSFYALKLLSCQLLSLLRRFASLFAADPFVVVAAAAVIARALKKFLLIKSGLEKERGVIIACVLPLRPRPNSHDSMPDLFSKLSRHTSNQCVLLLVAIFPSGGFSLWPISRF
jgi:hypothetical protein